LIEPFDLFLEKLRLQINDPIPRKAQETSQDGDESTVLVLADLRECEAVVVVAFSCYDESRAC
jgi:hypothetical protein